jgi:chlorite dismutase
MTEVLDLRERGAAKDGKPQLSDKRLWMQFLGFGRCADARPVCAALEKAGVEAVVYAGLHDPGEIGLLTMSEDPGFFVGELRSLLHGPAFQALALKPELTMLGRTYALGHEPDLEDWLLRKPRRTALDPAWPWAIWYPLRRAGAFNALPPEEQGPILREHGKIGHAFGESGQARDIRLACFGVDRADNDFVIGLVGKDLFPLSRCVQDMRKTKQTSQYLESLGPFFAGKAVWRSPAKGH